MPTGCRAHPDRPPATWATAQGIATLPLALLGYGAWWAWSAARGDAFPMPFGPRPVHFVGLMFAVGLLASWLGTLCWNEASQRLPTTLVGQLIVFETLSALLALCVLAAAGCPSQRPWPASRCWWPACCGALRVRPEPPVAHAA